MEDIIGKKKLLLLNHITRLYGYIIIMIVPPSATVNNVVHISMCYYESPTAMFHDDMYVRNISLCGNNRTATQWQNNSHVRQHCRP